MSQADITATPLIESFSELLDQSFQEMTSIEGSVVAGTVLTVEKDMILIDVGLKSEGRVPLREFGNNEEEVEVLGGDVWLTHDEYHPVSLQKKLKNMINS